MPERGEAKQYMVPHFDCPECGDVVGGFGQDDLVGEQGCPSCGAEVDVVGD